MASIEERHSAYIRGAHVDRVIASDAESEYARNLRRWERQMAANSGTMDNIQVRLGNIERHLINMEQMLEGIRSTVQELIPHEDINPLEIIPNPTAGPTTRMVRVPPISEHEVGEYVTDTEVHHAARPTGVRRIQPRRENENGQS